MSSQEKAAKKLALDEQTFQQLLESAYVLQKHAAATAVEQAGPSPSSAPASDPLGEVVETQKFIQERKLDIAEAAELIVDKARTIVHAQSAAIGIVEKDRLIFTSTSGKSTVEAGSSVVIAQSVASAVLLPGSSLFGKIVLCPDVETTPEINAESCRARGIRSLILVPVQYEGKLEAVLELASDRAHAFDARDVRLAELMASLLRDAIARAAEMAWKDTLASERATMLQAMDALQPQIERLITPGRDDAPAVPLPDVPAAEFSAASFTGGSEPVFSSARFGGEFAPTSDSLAPAEIHAEISDELRSVQFEAFVAEDEIEDPLLHTAPQAAQEAAESDVVARETTKAPWASATSTRQWLETLRPEKSAGLWLSRQWHAHRANFYLALSAILLLAVLSGWGTHSTGGVSANDARHNTLSGNPPLTLFEKGLVAIGLADPPPTQPSVGNPNTQVWIDLHTALYYCPGSPMYGKTPGGKYSLQRDAQLDQFEPANRQVCE